MQSLYWVCARLYTCLSCTTAANNNSYNNSDDVVTHNKNYITVGKYLENYLIVGKDLATPSNESGMDESFATKNVDLVGGVTKTK